MMIVALVDVEYCQMPMAEPYGSSLILPLKFTIAWSC